MILQLPVAADGDTAVFLEDGLGVFADASVEDHFFHIEKLLGVGSGQVIHLC